MVPLEIILNFCQEEFLNTVLKLSWNRGTGGGAYIFRIWKQKGFQGFLGKNLMEIELFTYF